MVISKAGPEKSTKTGTSWKAGHQNWLKADGSTVGVSKFIKSSPNRVFIMHFSIVSNKFLFQPTDRICLGAAVTLGLIFLREAPPRGHKRRTRCSASCLAHKPKAQPHPSQAHPTASPPWLAFACVRPSPLVRQREESLPTTHPSRVVLVFISRLFFFRFRPHPSDAFCAIKKTVDHIYRSRFPGRHQRTPPESLSVCFEIHTLFLLRLHIFRRLCCAQVLVLGSHLTIPKSSRKLHSERRFHIILHTYFISGKTTTY